MSQVSAESLGPALLSAGRGQEGVADLSLILTTAESSRLLNLSRIHKRWGRSEEYAAGPLFQNKILNRAIIMKFTPRPGELYGFSPKRVKATKILFPLDRNDLSQGAFSGVVGQRDFSRIMSRHLDGASRLTDRDERVLGLIDQLPTLDPFLLYAMLKSDGLEVSHLYFQLSEADRDAIQLEMAQAFTPLVALCRADVGGSDGVKSFVDKILNFEDSPEIDSLRAAFRFGPDLFAAAMFAWRGIIYYKWKTANLQATLTGAIAKLSAMTISEPGGAADTALAEQSRTKILKMAATASARVREINARYDTAFADFVERQQVDPFRQFLIQAPSLFLICGQSMAILEHIINFIETRQPFMASGRGADTESLMETFTELERELGVDFRVKAVTW